MERKGITKLNARVKELEETSKKRRSNKVSRVLGRLSQLSTPGHTVPIMVPRHQLPTRQPESESAMNTSEVNQVLGLHWCYIVTLLKSY